MPRCCNLGKRPVSHASLQYQQLINLSVRNREIETEHRVPTENTHNIYATGGAQRTHIRSSLTIYASDVGQSALAHNEGTAATPPEIVMDTIIGTMITTIGHFPSGNKQENADGTPVAYPMLMMSNRVACFEH